MFLDGKEVRMAGADRRVPWTRDADIDLGLDPSRRAVMTMTRSPRKIASRCCGDQTKVFRVLPKFSDLFLEDVSGQRVQREMGSSISTTSGSGASARAMLTRAHPAGQVHADSGARSRRV